MTSNKLYSISNKISISNFYNFKSYNSIGLFITITDNHKLYAYKEIESRSVR